MRKFAVAVAIAVLGATALPGAATASPSVAMGALCVLTNKEKPSDLDVVADRIIATKRKDTGGGSDLDKMARAATAEFGSGFFGHSWLIYTDNSGKAHTAGWRHEEGLVLDGPYEKPSRPYAKRRCLPVSEEKMKRAKAVIEEKVKGVRYTPVNNCTEFAGRVFTEVTGDKVAFRQDVSPLLRDSSDPDRQLLAALARKLLDGRTTVASPGQLGAGIAALEG